VFQRFSTIKISQPGAPVLCTHLFSCHPIFKSHPHRIQSNKQFETDPHELIDLAAMRILSNLTHLLLLANYCDAFNVANSQQMHSAPLTMIRSTRRSDDDGVMHSFVEGGEYGSQRAEIEAMGGGNT
jgi:hypothetical protein